MYADLLAGTFHSPMPAPPRRPTILVFDSGLGGLTVLAELAAARPDARIVYAADDAAFPYGALDEAALVRRVEAVIGRLVADHRPDIAIVACNTASTLVLPHLRARFEMPFVGTVPAIKPAAALSRTGRLAVLATPGTVRRDYTRGLIEAYAAGCQVELVGSSRLAALAEAELSGTPAPDEAIAAEIAPCFVADEVGRTDVVVLACTHYPLLLRRFRRLASWPVAWIDPAPAIARRVVQLLGPATTRPEERDGPDGIAIFTGAGPGDTLRRALEARGLVRIASDPFPLGVSTLT